jgi:hypothetical protein
MQHARCLVQHATRNIQHPTCNMKCPTCNMQCPTCNMQRPTCNVQHATPTLCGPTCAAAETEKLRSSRHATGFVRRSAGLHHSARAIELRVWVCVGVRVCVGVCVRAGVCNTHRGTRTHGPTGRLERRGTPKELGRQCRGRMVALDAVRVEQLVEPAARIVLRVHAYYGRVGYCSWVL